MEANLVQTAETCRALCERGHHVTWIAPRIKGDPDECLRPLGVEPHDRLELVEAPEIRLKNFGRYRSLLVRSALARDLRARARGRPTVVYFRTLKDSRLARFLIRSSRWVGAPVIYEAHKLYAEKRADQGFHDGTIRRARRLEQRVLEGADGVVCSHPALFDRIRAEHRPERLMITASNGVREMAAASRDDDPEYDAIYTGSLFAWKGVDVCLDAIARVDGGRLAVVGGNPSARFDELRQKATALGVEQRVTFFGQADRSRALELVARSRVALVPLDPAFVEGERYTCPLKMLEAMMLGVPVVAADSAAVRAFVRDRESAWLVPKGDPDAMAAAIDGLRGDRALADRIATAAREDALRNTFSARAEKIERFAASLLGDAVDVAPRGAAT